GWDYVGCLEQSVWTGRCGFSHYCRRVGEAAKGDLTTARRGGGMGDGGVPIYSVGDADRPGSTDLALGAAVGLIVGGAATLVVIMFFRRRWLEGFSSRAG
ncbi:unnamed protein product, partial [Discosporangium mesarthrocarpum]